MLEGYTIQKKITVNGKNLQVLFRDNESPPVFAFADILTITFNEYGRNTTSFIGKISDEHKEKVFFNHCDRWVLDFDGMAEFIRAFAEDPEDILDQIKTFIDNVYKGDLPSPVVVTKNDSNNKTIAVNEIQYEYKVSGNMRWFKTEDFVNVYGSKIKRNLKLLDTKDIHEGWISEDGLMDLLQIFETDKAFQDYESIIEACNHKEIIDKPWIIDDLSPISFVIDGDKSDISRFLFKTKDIRGEQLSVAYVLLDSGVVLLFYDIKTLATLLGISPETAAQATVKHCSFLFKDKDIFTNIVGVNTVLQKLTSNKEEAHALTREVCQAFHGTRDQVSLESKGELIYTTRDVIEIQEVKHSMKPVPIENTDYTAVDVAQISVNDATIITVFAKKNQELFDPAAEVIPMFGISSAGSAFNVNNSTMLAKSIPAEERGKVTLVDLRKNGVVVVTESGLKTFFRNVKEAKEARKIMNDISTAVIKYLRENKETINFTLSYWEKQEESAGIPIRGIVKTCKLFDDTHEVPVLIAKQDGKEVPYIAVEGLKYLEGIQVPTGDYVDQDNNRYISTQTLATIINEHESIKIPTDNFNEFILGYFAPEKAEKEPVPEKAVAVKKKTEKISQPVHSNVKAFVLSAVTLAENLRGMLVYFKNNGLKTSRLPGPSTISIITDLWKYIQCQELEGSIPLGFEKVVQTGIHRLDHMLKTAESKKG